VSTTPQTNLPPAPSPAPVSPWKAAFSNRAFLVAVAVLALAAVGLNAATEALQVYFKKQPVALRLRLDDPQTGVPERLGDWVMVDEQNTLDPDVQHSLGTKEFIFRTYVDSRAVPPEVMNQFKAMENDAAKAGTRHALLARIQEAAPHAVVSLNVTYYTGMADTVTHIPDRCMVADGYEPRNPETVTFAAGASPDGSPRQVQAQFSTFEDQTGRGRMNRNVAYFFHCNGGYEPNPVGVRMKLQNLLERHGYYAKIEMMTDEPAKALTTSASGAEAQKAAGARKAQASMADLLAAALPEVERCLPDWKQVKGNAAGAK